MRWHYRSRHESLITYSNLEIYTPNQHRLVTYPSAVERGEDLGVEFYHVADGRYGRGTTHDNPVEAAAVVRRVLHHATHSPDRTVGVVAFSEAQAQRIMDELDLARLDHPELDSWFANDRLDGFFIKNLENVQGDERDVILFSVGYAYDDAGRLTLNFGPLNKPGGYRRLNVAVTRARRRVELFSSITHRDIDRQIGVGANTNEGVRHLRNYLAYAAEGVQALNRPTPDTDAETESPFEDSVLATLRSWGWDVVPQVGHAGYRIDLAVRHPSRPGDFILGIECDGWAYHSSPVARDRDRLRQEILEGLGWRLHRIWGTAWYRRRAHEEQRLREALDLALSGSTTAGNPTPASIVTINIETVDLGAPPSWAVPYKRTWATAPLGMTMDHPVARSHVERIIVATVQEEGPIADSFLKTRVRDAFRAGRVGANMQAALDRSVASLIRSGHVNRPEPGFLDIPDRPVRAVRHTDGRDPATSRSIEQISAAEIELAIVQLVGDALAIDIEELKTRVRALFGFDRTGKLIDARIQACADRLAAQGHLRHRDGMLEAA
ncbi:MAG: hypothetical protein LC792_23500 [Actinobacteria bacterium]|nr:hypothetical protein [Actinomycetota bacterium]